MLGIYIKLVENGRDIETVPQKFREAVRVTAEAFLSLFLPFLDETIQLFTEGRSGQVDDVWLDVAGVCFGTLCMVIFWKMLCVFAARRGRRKRPAG